MHGGRWAVRAHTIAGTVCMVRGSRGMVTCPLPTYRLAKSSHSLIKSTIAVAQCARSAVRAVWVCGVAGKRSYACGRSACSRRPVHWSTRRVARYKRSHKLAEKVFPAVQLVASVGREARSSGRRPRRVAATVCCIGSYARSSGRPSLRSGKVLAPPWAHFAARTLPPLCCAYR